MHSGVAVVVSIFAVLVISGISVLAQASTAASNEPEHAKCRALWQHTLPGQTMKAGVLDDDLDELRLKVCGAWPGCTSCVEMAEGDCRYVFPTNVMVYSENKAGVEKICACQVLGCQLPWDPGKWGRKCAVPLGCYSKPSYILETGFPAALCGGKENNRRVRFGPLSFVYQTYSKPGIAMLTYEDDKIVDRKYLLFPKVGGYDSESDAVGKDLKQAAERLGGAIKAIIEVKPENNVLKAKEGDRNLLIYRQGDMICVQDNGTNKEKGVVVGAGKCFPIPSAPIPVLYAYKGQMTPTMTVGYRQEKLKLIPRDALVKMGYREAMEKVTSETKEENLLIQDVRIEYDSDSKGNVEKQLVQPVVEAVESLEYKKNGDVQGEECKLESSNNGAVQVYSAKRAVEKVVKNNLYTERGVIKCGYGMKGGDYPQCLSEEEYNVLFQNGKGQIISANTTGGIRRFNGYWREDTDIIPLSMMTEKQSQLLRSGKLFVTPNEENRCRFSMAHTYGDWKKEGSGKCEYFDSVYAIRPDRSTSAINKKSVLCPRGVLNVEDMEYEVLVATHCSETQYCEFGVEGRRTGIMQQGESEIPVMMKYTRIRVKKKPKTLRRYAIVNNNGTSKRIRCDDRYSIDLYTVSQEVLDNSRVSDNKFKFPMKYLGQSVSEDSKDPCHSSKSNIVYYYEYGGFVAGEEASKKCGNPVEEYYTPEKKVVGCEYDYIRADNYEPFLQGLTSVDSVSVVPLSKYEQGICIDNFEKTWFTPTKLDDKYLREQLATNIVGKDGSCCLWDANPGRVVVRYDAGNRSKAKVIYSSFEGVRREYAYRIPDNTINSAEGGDVCTLYRIEMWGGGEAASYTKDGFKRSGRPGQYVMLALDFAQDRIAKIKSKYVGEAIKVRGNTVLKREDRKPIICPLSNHWECHEYNVGKAARLFLVLKVGRGGRGSRPSRGIVGKGEDTILSLCNGDDPYITGRGVRVNNKWKYTQVLRPLKWERCEVGKYASNYCRKKEKTFQDEKKDCYEIARAVGGGSEKIREPNYAMAKNIMVYYRTIYGDVLSGDEASNGLLEGHNAMFTKFSLEMNLRKKSSKEIEAPDPILKIVNNRWYFEGRSMPRRFCKWKKTWHEEDKEVLIPGRGGCWKSASGERDVGSDEAGVGENGAVMITCERWEKVGQDVQGS